MISNLSIVAVEELPLELEVLIGASESEGYRFASRLRDEWIDGKNRFNKDNECLAAAFVSKQIAAIGGINHDPYIDNEGVGRLRHVYVSQEFRREGLGRALVHWLLDKARPNYDVIRLRIADDNGALFYESLGFERVKDSTASHSLTL